MHGIEKECDPLLHPSGETFSIGKPCLYSTRIEDDISTTETFGLSLKASGYFAVLSRISDPDDNINTF